MLRYFIQLSYDGTAYHGWQIQPNGVSVQETLQGALSTLLRRDVEVVGAGRTDTGVHARMMVAHMDSPAELDAAQLCYKLNKLLPRDIAVQRIWPVADDMHARFSATSRTYHYYIHTRKSPFLRHYSWLVTFPLDFDRMNEAAQCLLRYEDFTSFSKTQTDTKTNLCHITEARWEQTYPQRTLPQQTLPQQTYPQQTLLQPLPCREGGIYARPLTTPLPTREGLGEGLLGEASSWCFTITANRFLRNMVRAIVGTLIEVGRGRMTVEEFCQVIERKDRCSAGESVPGHALFLTNVSYDLKDSKDPKDLKDPKDSIEEGCGGKSLPHYGGSRRGAL